MVQGQVHVKQRDYERALQAVADAWELYEEIYGKDSEQVANCYLELSNIHTKKKEFAEAIAFQEKAIILYRSMEKYSNTEFLAQILITLSELQEKVGSMT